jgi:hypothetical protein
MRRGVTNLVGTHQGADFGQTILRAEVGIGVTASKSLIFAVQRMQRRMKGGGIFHSIMLDLHRRTGRFRATIQKCCYSA